MRDQGQRGFRAHPKGRSATKDRSGGLIWSEAGARSAGSPAQGNQSVRDGCARRRRWQDHAHRLCRIGSALRLRDECANGAAPRQARFTAQRHLATGRIAFAPPLMSNDSRPARARGGAVAKSAGRCRSARQNQGCNTVLGCFEIAPDRAHRLQLLDGMDVDNGMIVLIDIINERAGCRVKHDALGPETARPWARVAGEGVRSSQQYCSRASNIPHGVSCAWRRKGSPSTR